jgi:hypothetical protein
LRYKGPVLVESFELSNEIRQHISTRINKPIQLMAMRRGIETGAAAILNSIDKLIETHCVSELQSFSAFIKRNNTVPRIAYKAELEVGFELFSTDLYP